MSNYTRELRRRVKHAQGMQYMAEGKHKEAQRCFREVIADAKGQANEDREVGR